LSNYKGKIPKILPCEIAIQP